MSDLNGAAYYSSTVVDFQQILKQLVLFSLILVVSAFLQVDGLSHSPAEVNHGVASVATLQGLIAAGQPGHTKTQGQLEI